MSDWKPLQYTDGHLPLEDHGLISDGITAALVARDGSIPPMGIPRFDSLPLFCGILDTNQGGAITTQPENILEARHYYGPIPRYSSRNFELRLVWSD